MGDPDILAFWFGEPDEVTPAYIRDAAIASLAAGETFYTQNFGIPELREAHRGLRLAAAPAGPIGRPHRRHRVGHVGADARRAGAGRPRRSRRLRHAAVAEPDRDPEDPRRRRRARARSHFDRRGWTLDLDRLLAALTPGTRAVMINSPNNPDRLDHRPRRAARDPRALPQHGIWIVADDVYERLYYAAPDDVRAVVSRHRRRRTTAWSAPTAFPSRG